MKNKVLFVLKKELREVFRDKKSLAMMLVVPIILIPLMIIGLSALFNDQNDKQLNEYNKIGFAYNLSQDEEELVNYLKIESYTGNLKKMKKLFKKEEINCYIVRDGNTYTINYDKNKEASLTATNLAKEYLEQYKMYLQNNYLISKNMDSNKVINIISIDYNIIGDEHDNFFAKYMTNYVFIFIMMAITISATYPATDATAGEKERGTMETLLTFPITKKDIIIGKYLSVSLSSIITGVLGFILGLVSLSYSKNTFEIYKDIDIIPNTQTIILTIFIIISFALLISGLCIAVASMSKSFKEAQSALTPITLLSSMPGMFAFLLDIKTTSVYSVIPFLSHYQIYSDIVSGKYNYLNIGLMFISTFIYISIVLFVIIKQYRNEKILFTN